MLCGGGARRLIISHTPHKMEMESTRAYAVAIGGVFLFLLLLNSRRLARLAIRFVRPFLSHLSFVRVGPWRLSTILLASLFLAVNIYAAFFDGAFAAVPAREVRARSAKLAMINLVPAAAGPSHSFVASALGIRLETFRKVHRTLALAVIVLVACHGGASIAARETFSLGATRDVWAVVVSHRGRVSARSAGEDNSKRRGRVRDSLG